MNEPAVSPHPALPPLGADGAPAQVDAARLAALLGPDGPLAQQLPGYAPRPGQVAMAQAVQRALTAHGVALIEAPTGTGKSIAYLLPALLSGRTVVVATANKSLQHQLYTKDVPFLSQVLDRPIDAVLVKGRSNFVCTYKWEREAGEQRRFAVYDREHAQVSALRRWLEETESGDIDDLPFVLDADLRPRIVSFADDCLHRECSFYAEQCWVNRMRDQALEAQVVITNHHLLLNALELGEAGERILPPASIYVIDEAHQLEATATAVFEVAVTDHTVEQLLARAVFKEHLDDEELDKLRFQNTRAFQEVAYHSRENSFRLEGELEEMQKLGHALDDLHKRMQQANPYRQRGPSQLQESEGAAENEPSAERGGYERALEALDGAAKRLSAVASARRDGEVVRYVSRVFDRRHVSIEVHAAPINAATYLQRCLFQPTAEQGGEEETAARRTVICTSATLSTQGNFDHFKQRCGIAQVSEELTVGAAFDYPRQALLYQPALPAYDWRNKDGFYSAASGEIQRLLELSRGRALCLFTSWGGLQQVRERLTADGAAVIWPLRAQGDAPRSALLRWFIQTPHSVLLATKSFWEGVDIPGDDLSLVVLDKLPFPTPSDPLHSARMRAIDDGAEHDGPAPSFAEYMVPLMTLTLKQGFGRLIRRSSDRGVVAILDQRLSSKAYGRRARQDLPPAVFSRAYADVHRFFRQALASHADFALNVLARRAGGGLPDRIEWRWQLVRLQDGRTDSGRGLLTGAEAVDGEVAAAVAGLQDLAARVKAAGRQPHQFGVELRCSQAAATGLEAARQTSVSQTSFQQESARWKALQILGLEPPGSQELLTREAPDLDDLET